MARASTNQVSPDIQRVLRKIVTGVNLNAATTDVATVIGMPAKYRLRKVTYFDASASMAASLATVGIFTASAGGGSALVALSTTTALTASSKTMDATLASIATSDYQTGGSLYIRCGVANGSAITVSIAIEIESLV